MKRISTTPGIEIPEIATLTDLRPVQHGSGFEVYWECHETKEAEGLDIYAQERTIQGWIYLSPDGKEIGRKVQENDWTRIKNNEWAETKALTNPDAEKIKAETGALKFYMPGIKND